MAGTLSVVAIAAALGGCGDSQGKVPVAEDTSYRLRPGYVIDSVKPVEVELEAFRTGMGLAPTEFTAAATSFDQLLANFARAVQARDTVALDRMQITPAEFAWLIYPSSPYTKPPYRESPRMVWAQLRSSGDVGLTRLLKRRGGSSLRIVGHRCDPAPLVEGANTLWRHCAAHTLGPAGDTLSERLFGVVIERYGRFKFASYQNQY